VGNPLVTFLNIMLVALIFFIGAMVLTAFINLMPANPLTNGVKGIYLSVFAFFDNSFFFLLLFLLIVDIAGAYHNPSIIKGIGNFVFILGFGFMFLNTRNTFVGALGNLSFSVLMPNTYATLNNNYLAVLLFFMLIIATALNFRPKDDEKEGGSGET